MNNVDDSQHSIFRFGDFELQPKEQRFLENGKPVELGSRAFQLLLMLVAHAGKLISKKAIIASLWPDVVVEENNLHVQISQLRKVLGTNMIATVSGQGYRFTSQVVKLNISEASNDTDKSFTNLKILIVDDHVLIREALSGVIHELVSDCQLLNAGNVVQARTILNQHLDIDLVLLDLQLPDVSGRRYLTELRNFFPQISVVIISAGCNREDVLATIGEGAQGYIPKSATLTEMIQAFKLIFSGGVYIPSEIFTTKISGCLQEFSE